MNQLPESDLPVDERLARIREAGHAGCTGDELANDAEVALSVLDPQS